MRIIVTGGAGFIGRNYIRYILDNHSSYSIHCIDNLKYAGMRENISEFENNSRFEFSKVDINDYEFLEELFIRFKPQLVCHFAAETHVDRSISDPLSFAETNFVGTLNLLELSKKYEVSRFHHVSTDEVYGSLDIDNKNSFHEKSNLDPNSPYSASKASSDLIVIAYHRTYNLNVTLSRCSNNYGPYQFPEKLIPKVIINAMTRKKIPVYGNGINVRDWLYVEDHVRAIDLITHKGIAGEIYNISSGDELSNIELITRILTDLNLDENLIQFVEDRLGHDIKYSVDSKKLRNELGWSPMCGIDEGLSRTIHWYSTNSDWIRTAVKKRDYE